MRYVWYFVLFLSVIQNYIYNSSVYSLLVHHSTIGEHYLIMKVFDVVHHTTRTHSLCERGPSKATGRAAEAASVSSITVPWVAALPKRWSTVGHHHNKEVSCDQKESTWKIS